MDPPITFSPYAGGSKRVLLIADVNNGEFLRFDYQGNWLYYYLVTCSTNQLAVYSTQLNKEKKIFCCKTTVTFYA